MTDQQKLFVEGYLTTFNATKAAIAAGYSPKTARSQASDLLTSPNIQARISQRLADAAMSANEVIARLTRHARADIADVLNSQGKYSFRAAQGNDATDLITEIAHGKDGTKVKIVSSQAALIQLSKIHGLEKSKVEHEFSHLSDADLVERAKKALRGDGTAGTTGA